MRSLRLLLVPQPVENHHNNNRHKSSRKRRHRPLRRHGRRNRSQAATFQLGELSKT
jgi:hypothetical protein